MRLLLVPLLASCFALVGAARLPGAPHIDALCYQKSLYQSHTLTGSVVLDPKGDPMFIPHQQGRSLSSALACVRSSAPWKQIHCLDAGTS